MDIDGNSKLATVPHRVTDKTRIPVARYFDEEFFRLECEQLWSNVWQMACRLEEIPDVGDWCEYQILEKSVIILRTSDGIKAFHNACRHRGVKLANGSGNCLRQGLTCPFHGWRWNMDGENTFVYGRDFFLEKDLDPKDIALASCRVETWGGCAFVNFNKNAPPLLASLGPAAERMGARGAGDLKVEWWRSAILPTNWKLAMEAFMEGYHVMATHPQFYEVSPTEDRIFGPEGPGLAAPAAASSSIREFVDLTVARLGRLREGMAGMVQSFELEIAESLKGMELPADVAAGAAAFYGQLNKSITDHGRARGLPIPDLNDLAMRYPFKAVEFFFPNYFLLPMFAGMSSYRIRPLGPESCLFEIWSLAHLTEDDPREELIAPTPWRHDDPAFPEIPRQDYSNLPQQQLGLHAGGLEFLRLSPKVEGMISNYQRVIDGYLAELDPNKLAAAAAVACSEGLDSPVLEIGI